MLSKIKGWSTRFLSIGGREWQKSHHKCSIHWCEWRKLGELKEDGNLGFRCLSKFNIAMLTKQRVAFVLLSRFIISEVIKTKYYPN
ncbi:reverse transcriptase [Gossypium australe]|uniref:Reverse transcriptase n=1 Tax=Gossypium australe TaxID=47621 RepID=A0A5B6UX57_9ROSI|nr:reverse transcriptase [Gossypium australe]